MLESLADKVAWVTGAGTGIGQAGAVALAKEGARIVLSGRRKEPLLETERIISEAGGEAVIETLDVGDPAAVQGVADRIHERYGRLDILVNNAGTNVAERHWGDVDAAKWDEVVTVDLNGAFYCVSAVIPIMRRQKDGLIINVASWAGRFDTYVTGPAYSAAKHGVVAMNASINIEECVNGIRACVICPGEVWTPIIDRRPDALAEDVKAKMLRSEDLGETILFVARMPRHVCLNEILISPAWNRMYVNDPTRPPVEGK